jgi:D-glycero-D-manno-heptose 1,7-bisphosphate phosphatase
MSAIADRPLRPALFLDRDGVINIDKGFAYRPDQIDWVDGAIEAIRLANARGYLVVVVTNQSGVARGYYGEEAVISLHRWMQERFAEAGARVDQFLYCPHHPDGSVPEYSRVCDCRKPAPGMLLEALAGGIRADASLLVGDRDSDLEAARRAGIAGHLFVGGNLRDFIDPLLPDRGVAPRSGLG